MGGRPLGLMSLLGVAAAICSCGNTGACTLTCPPGQTANALCSGCISSCSVEGSACFSNSQCCVGTLCENGECLPPGGNGGAGTTGSAASSGGRCGLLGCANSSGGNSSAAGSSGGPGSTGGSTTAGPTGGESSTGGSVAGSSTGGSTGSSFVEAPHAPFPNIPDNGGPVVATPGIVTFNYQNDSWASVEAGWAKWVVGSTWLTEVGKDYGVGLGTYGASYTFQSAAPQSETDLDVQDELTYLFSSGALSPVSDTIYFVFLPPGTIMTGVGGLGVACVDFAGYHHWFNYGSSTVIYAVVADCDGDSWISGVADPAAIEITASHELMEAATDPLGFAYFQNGTNASAYNIENQANAWLAVGDEVGDLCVWTSYQDPAAGYWAQRIWSNSAAAAATGSPCVPVPATETFYSLSGPEETVFALPGATLTGDFTGWSSGPGANWCVADVPLGGDFAVGAAVAAGAANDALDNGASQTLNISVPADAGFPSPNDAGVVPTRFGKMWLMSGDCASGAIMSVWPVFLAIPPVGTACTLPASGQEDQCQQVGLACMPATTGASCLVPGPFSGCMPTVGCTSPAQCLAFDGGTVNLCAQTCQQTNGCDVVWTDCGSLQGQAVCLPDYCSSWDLPCNAAGASDGTCIPYPNSAGQTSYGLCWQGGSATGSCDPYGSDRGNQASQCAVGQACLPTSTTSAACFPICDPLRPGNPACPGTAPTCTALGGGTSPDLGYCHA